MKERHPTLQEVSIISYLLEQGYPLHLDLFDRDDLLLSKRDILRIEQLLYACNNPDIRNNKQVMRFLTVLKNPIACEELRRACEIDEIRKDKDLIDIIVKQKSLKAMKKTIQYCKDPTIRQDKAYLKALTEDFSWLENQPETKPEVKTLKQLKSIQQKEPK